MITTGIYGLWLARTNHCSVLVAHLVPVACICVPDLLNEVEYEPR
jgi:hypothetical protein